MPVEWMRYVSQTAHPVDEIHTLLRGKKRWDAAGYEQADHLTFERLDLFSRNRQLGCNSPEAERTFDRVVISQRETVEAAFACSLDQLRKRATSVMRKVGVEMQIDAEHH